MPSILMVKGYKIFIWTKEPNEPIHVHVCKGDQLTNDAKIWLTSTGGLKIAHNNARIPRKDLKVIMRVVLEAYADVLQHGLE